MDLTKESRLILADKTLRYAGSLLEGIEHSEVAQFFIKWAIAAVYNLRSGSNESLAETAVMGTVVDAILETIHTGGNADAAWELARKRLVDIACSFPAAAHKPLTADKQSFADIFNSIKREVEREQVEEKADGR